MTVTHVFERAFRPLYRLPCWNVQPGYGTFLILEFGEPHLSIREPRDASSDVSARLRKLFARRHVFVHGDWHLWIHSCEWTVHQDRTLVGDSTSNRRIKSAADVLDGQQLASFNFTLRGCRSSFVFDLGATLETWPYDRKGEQWLLYQPSGKVLRLRADKKYCHSSKDAAPNTERWRPIAKKA